VDYEGLARIVEHAKQGDDEAFAQLFVEFSKPVYYNALHITKNEHDAHDVVQDTMIALHRNLHSIKDVKSVVAYVNKIASRQSIRILRTRSPEHVYDDASDALQNVAEDNENFIPEGYVAQKERRDYIVGLVDELSDTQRTAVMLFYFEQLPIKQIAEITEVEEATVKMRLSRARAVLKVKMSQM